MFDKIQLISVSQGTRVGAEGKRQTLALIIQYILRCKRGMRFERQKF